MSNRFRLKVSDDDDEVAYLQLGPETAVRKVAKSVRLYKIYGKYEGPDVVLDFDDENRLIGIEFT